MSNPRKVLRSPTLRRKSKTKPLSERIHLEKVLGVTASNTSAVDCDPQSGTVAYPAGCVVVLLHPKKKQSHLISRKTITCLSFSRDGRHLVTGESGHQPAVRVWDLEDKTQVAEFHGHKFAVNCVKFSPNLRYIVSIGSQHDGMVNVWNWKTKATIASNKVATKVTDLAFNEEANVFVTVGNRHVKFWYLDHSKSRVNETVPLMGRSGILGEQRNNFFCAVCCGRSSRASTTYSITKSGLLCEFNDKRLLDKWVELRTTSANAVTVGEELIYVGCADGIVRIFSAHSLHFIASLPRPHYLGVDVSKGVHPSQIPSPPSDGRYPDTIAVVLDDINKKVTCVYNDHSIYIWDVKDVRKVGKSRSFLFHSGCIWGVEIYPTSDSGQKPALPPGSFITCSSDDTIRIWNLDPHMNSEETFYKKNIYSNELLKVVYTDSNLNNILDIDFNPAGKTDKTDTTCLDKNGVRCIKVSPGGQNMAAGDRMGNIRVYEMQFMGEVAMLEAHDSEVLCLEYTRPETGVHLLASASRDRLIHVFDTEQNYGLIQTLDDHSSAITSVRFTEQDGQLNMLSCGADKSLLFRSAQQDPDFQFVLNRHLVGKTTLYDMDVDATKKFVATACQDRNVRIYNIKNGKQKRCYKGAVTDDGTLIKIQLDASGSYAATSCSDKNLAVYDFFSGECMASMFGHSELVTGLKFMNDLKHLITVSGDGCIFVWRLPSELTENMYRRMMEVGKVPRDPVISQDLRRATYVPTTPKMLTKWDNNNSNYQIMAQNDEPDANANLQQPVTPKTDWRFSVGHLPAWAKKQVMQDPQSKNTSPDQAAPAGPRGRWAARAENQGIVMKSMLDENSAIQLSLADSMDRRRLSVEPDNIGDQLSEFRRETMVLNKPAAVPIITDDDENNRDDDDDDDEFCSNRDQIEERFNEDGRKVSMDSHVGSSRGSEPFMSNQKRMNMDPSRWSDFGLKRDEDNDGEEEDEEEEGDTDGKEIIYLPDEGSESEGTIASSFQVFEGDANSYKDGEEGLIIPTESEGTDPLSMSDEESEPPTPTTPIDPNMEFLNGLSDPAKEGLFRSNFENLGSSPAHLEQFGHSLEAMEQQLNNRDPSRFLTSRLSISSRFLSRAQQQHLRSIAMNRGQTQSPGSAHMTAVQKRKEEMTKAVEETRKRLQTLGWISHSENVPEKDTGARPPSGQSGVNNDLPSPPTRLSRQDFNAVDPPGRGRMSMGGERVPSRSRKEESKQGRHSLDPGSSRKWKSMVDITGGRTTPSFSLPNSKQSLRSKTPTPTRTSSLSSWATSPPPRYVTKTEVRLESPNRSRSRGPHDEEDEFTAPSRSRSERNLASDRDAPPKPGKSSLRRVHSYQMHTESSVAKSNKTENGSSSPRRTSSGIRRGRLSAGMKKQYKSTPDLASQTEEEELSMSSTRTVDDFADLANHVPELKRSEPKSMPQRTMHATHEVKDPFGLHEFGRSAPGPDEVSRSSSDSFSSSPSSGDALEKLRYSSSVPGEGGPRECDGDLVNNVNRERADRMAMPPPTSSILTSKSKQIQDTFLKKAVKAKQADLTLAQAKDILMGKSSMLQNQQDSTDSESGLLQVQERMDRRGMEGMDRSPHDLPEKDQSPSKDRVAQQAEQAQISPRSQAKSRVEISNIKLGTYPGRRSPHIGDRRESGSESTSSREGDSFERTSLRLDLNSSRESDSPRRRPTRRTPVHFPSERAASTPPHSSSPPPSPTKSVRERASMFEELSPDKHSRSFSPSKFKRSPSPVKKIYSEFKAATLPRSRERRAPSPVKMPQNFQGSSVSSEGEGDSMYPAEGSPTTVTNHWEGRRGSSDLLSSGAAPWRRGSRGVSNGSLTPDMESSPPKPDDKPARARDQPLSVRFSGLPSSSSPSDTSSTTTTPSTTIPAPSCVAPAHTTPSSDPDKISTSRTLPNVPSSYTPISAQAGSGSGGTKPAPEDIPSEGHPPSPEVREGEPDMEVKQNENIQQYPPPLPDTAPPSETTSSKVTLAQPSPSTSDPKVGRPDRSKLNLPLDKTGPTSPSPIPEEQDDQACYQLVQEFTQATKKMTEALAKATQQQNRHQVALLSTAMHNARTNISGAIGDDMGSTDNLQKDVKELISQNSAQLAEGISQLLLRHQAESRRGQPTVTDV